MSSAIPTDAAIKEASDAKAGQFNINGTVPLGSSLSFIPLAWRVFQDDILNMGRKTWAELYFADDKGAVCAVLFHGYSVENLYCLIEPLFYDDLTPEPLSSKVSPSACASPPGPLSEKERGRQCQVLYLNY